MADSTPNDELLDKTEKLLEKHEELREVLSEESSITNDILASNELNNSELDKTLSYHNEINERTKEEEESNEKILGTRSEINDKLSDTHNIKRDINSESEKSVQFEDSVNDKLFEQNQILDEILRKKEELNDKIKDGRDEEEKLLGFSKDIITALQTALSVQLQLNAAIAAGNNNGGGSGNASGGGNGGGNNSGGNGGNAGNGTPKKPNLFGKYAANAFSSGVSYLKRIATDVLNKWVEIDKQTFTTGRKMGMTLSQMNNFRKNITANYGEIANRLGMTFEEIFKFQQSYIQQTGRAISLTNKQVESFAGLSKIVGESAVSEMAKNMDEFGASSQSAIDNLTLNLARAANQGLNVEETSSKFAKNIKLASKYTFRNGIDGISKMTLMSQRLKFNMESISQAMDKFSTIEDAISSSANLQVLGGAYASNFSNPLIAMGEALIDGEGFTKRIVDTVSRTATFNANTGVVEMSPIEKAKMREASKITGINYDELWNMASQQAKLSNIEKHIGGKNFTEEQKTFLANTAQYDAKTREWYVTRMGKNGEEKVALSKVKDANELGDIQRSNNFEKSIQGDVHSIREKLDDYLKQYVQDSKTAEETYKGQMERVKIDFSDSANAMLGDIKELLKGMSKTQFIMSGILMGVSGFLFEKGTSLIENMLKGMGKGTGKAVARGSKLLGRKLLKSVPGIGLTIEAVSSGVNAYEANKEHKERVNEINEDQTLSQEEKERAISESTNERNKSFGKSIGQTAVAIGGHVVGKMAGKAIGRKIGGAIGAIGGPIGAMIGMGIGHLIGGAIGGWVGGKVSSSASAKPQQNNSNDLAMNSSNKTISNTANTQVKSVIENLPNSNDLAMANDIHSIRKSVDIMSLPTNAVLSSKNVKNEHFSKNNIFAANYVNNFANGNTIEHGSVVTPYQQYDKKTYVREVSVVQVNGNNGNQKSIDKIDINVSGTLKLQGDGKSKNIDIEEVFKSPEFQRMLMTKINEGFSKNGSVVQSRSLDTTQAIMGGYYTPNYLNSKS